MAKIRSELKNVLAGKTIMLTKLSIENEKKFADSPFTTSLPITFKSFREAKCFWCENPRTNFCWNCERPHCDKHARAIFFPTLHIINTFCLECAEELEKEVEK